MIPNSPFFLIYISIRRGVTPGPVAQGHANRTGGGGCRMGGNDHTARQSRRDERHIRAIEEGGKVPVSLMLLAFHLPWPSLSCFFHSISRCASRGSGDGCCFPFRQAPQPCQPPGRCASHAGCAPHHNESPGPETGTRARHRAVQVAYPAGASTGAPDSHAASSARPVSGYPGSSHVRRFPCVPFAQVGPAVHRTCGDDLLLAEGLTLRKHLTARLEPPHQEAPLPPATEHTAPP